MKTFLSDPLFWIRETLRWHWREIIIISLIIWFFLLLVLIVANLV